MGNQKETQKIRNINMRLQEKNYVLELGQSVKNAICNLVGAFLMLIYRYFVSGTGICRRTVFCSKNMGCD